MIPGAGLAVPPIHLQPSAMNPLLDFSGLPRFDAVQPEHVAPAIRELIAESRTLVEQLSAPESQASWDAFMQPLTDAGERPHVPAFGRRTRQYLSYICS